MQNLGNFIRARSRRHTDINLPTPRDKLQPPKRGSYTEPRTIMFQISITDYRYVVYVRRMIKYMNIQAINTATIEPRISQVIPLDVLLYCCNLPPVDAILSAFFINMFVALSINYLLVAIIPAAIPWSLL